MALSYGIQRRKKRSQKTRRPTFRPFCDVHPRPGCGLTRVVNGAYNEVYKESV
jgi:hypothetical protein